MRYKLSEYKRENERLNEKLACMGPNYDSSKREIDRIIDQRDQLRARVNELKQDNKTLQVTHVCLSVCLSLCVYW